jgi:hypothetical protein
MDSRPAETLFDRIAQGLTESPADRESSRAATQAPVSEWTPPSERTTTGYAHTSDEADTSDHAHGSTDDQVGSSVVIDGRKAWPAPDVSTQMDRPSVTERQCSRTGCSDTAAVSLSYHYGQSQVWIDRLSPEREPHAYDMCDRHAQSMSVPQGWHLDDRRGARRGALIAV